MASSLIKEPVHDLEWKRLGYWTPRAGETITVSTTSSMSIDKAEMVMLTPFSFNAFRNSVIIDYHDFEANAAVTWCYYTNNTLNFYSLNVKKTDATHVQITASANIPSDTRLEMVALAKKGTY